MGDGMAEGGSSLLDSNKGRQEMNWSDKLSEATKYKEAGNAEYKAGHHKSAIGKYHRALLYLKGISKRDEDVGTIPFFTDPNKTKLSDDVKVEVAQLTIDCYNNLSACLLLCKSPNYEKVMQYCDCVLTSSPYNVKALYRRGVAAYHLKLPEDGLESLQKAERQPGGQKDGNIKIYIRLCEQAKAKQDQQLKDTYKAMFTS